MNFSGRSYIIIFSLITLVVFAAGYYYYSFRVDTIKQQKYQELSVIAELKTRQITDWRSNIISEGELIARNKLLISEIKAVISGSKTAELLIDRLSLERDFKDFNSVSLYDVDGNCIYCDSLFVPAADISTADILQNKIPFLSEILSGKDTTIFVINLYIPLILTNVNKDEYVGVLILQENPNDFIYPLILSWPTPSRTAETLIFHVENDSLVYLNKLRHSSRNPLTYKFSVSEEDLPAAMLARGITGIVEGVDYRGVPVLADLRKIPDSNWLLITKIDQEEVFSILNEQIVIVVMSALIILAALGFGMGVIWKSHNVKMLKRLYISEVERKNILTKFENITNQAYDIIILTDLSGNINFANRKASELYEYSNEDLTSMNITGLRKAGSEDFHSIIQKLEKGAGLIFEDIHRTKTNRLFPVEVSASLIESDGSRFLQSIMRDISERKALEEMIRKSLREKDFLLKEIHHRIKNNLQIIASMLRLQGESIENQDIRHIFDNSSNRINTIAMVHQKLYTHNSGTIYATEYIPELMHLLSRTFSVDPDIIKIKTDIEKVEFVTDDAVYLGLLINEIVANSYKHAFPAGRKGIILISLRQENSKCTLSVSDNGIGMPDNNNKTGLGMQLIFTFAEQLEGELELENSNGTKYTLTFQNQILL
jgi:PAS domain S-box-containing protein